MHTHVHARRAPPLTQLANSALLRQLGNDLAQVVDHLTSASLHPVHPPHAAAAAAEDGGGQGGGGEAAAAAAAGGGGGSQEQQQLLTRLSDVPREPLCVLSPITGVADTPRQPVMKAAEATGVRDMDAHGFVAGEYGTELAREDPHGLDADEAGAISLYTSESELYTILNELLRQRNRARLKPFFAYLRLLLDARRKLPRWSCHLELSSEL